MLFTYLSATVDPNSTSRIAVHVISGIGFWELMNKIFIISFDIYLILLLQKK